MVAGDVGRGAAVVRPHAARGGDDSRLGDQSNRGRRGAGVTSYLLDRYVQDETARFTREAVASHFGPVFEEDVFQRPLATEERELLETIVSFHFSIYNVVRTQFFDTKGTIVFSYDQSEIGRRIDPASQAGLAAALGGSSYTARTDVIGDSRYAALGTTAYAPTSSADPAGGEHEHGAASGAPAPALFHTLETWVPVQEGDKLVGAAVVWRDLAAIDRALNGMQMSTSALIALAALLLWLVLRGVYVRSSRQIMSQSHALGAALAETERTYDTTLQALSNALDVRDSETEGHSRRVVEYMELIIAQMPVVPARPRDLRAARSSTTSARSACRTTSSSSRAALSEESAIIMKRHPENGAAHPRADPVPRRCRRASSAITTSAGTARATRWARRRGDPARRAHLRGRGRLRRDDERPSLPPRDAARGRPRRGRALPPARSSTPTSSTRSCASPSRVSTRSPTMPRTRTRALKRSRRRPPAAPREDHRNESERREHRAVGNARNTSPMRSGCRSLVRPRIRCSPGDRRRSSRGHASPRSPMRRAA